MKKISLYSMLACITVLFLCSCDTHKEEKEAYEGFWRWSLEPNLIWDEITYEINNPQNYILTQYQLIGDTMPNNEVKLFLHKDGERIGDINVTQGGQVYFSNEAVGNTLLYDFGKMDKKFDGYYEYGWGSSNPFLKKIDWDSLYAGIVYFSHWNKDGKDGYIISGLGSTNGFLSKIDSVPNEYKRMVLQIYKSFPELYINEKIYTVVFYSAQFITKFNKDISQFNLSESFWK